MYTNHSKYELNKDGKYDVYYKGFDYIRMSMTRGWEKKYTVDTEEEAKQKAADLLPEAD